MYMILYLLYWQDALTLQRLCLEKKVELVDDWSNEVPDIKGALQEMMTSLFISTYNHQVDFIIQFSINENSD